jgi:hypothetical protein
VPGAARATTIADRLLPTKPSERYTVPAIAGMTDQSNKIIKLSAAHRFDSNLVEHLITAIF